MTDEQLRKIYFPLAESWNLIRQYADSTGTIVEFFRVQEQSQMIFEKAEKTKFSEEILAATVNEIDRIMRENGGK